MYFTSRIPSPEMGDITIGWTVDQAEMMVEIIQKKMDEGFTFFILDEVGREVRLHNISQLGEKRHVTIGDKEAELLIREGKIGIVDVSGMVEETDSEPPPRKAAARRATSATEAASANTVATRRMGSG